MPKANPKLDLTTVLNVQNWLRSNNQPGAPAEADQQNIQDCITAASIYWLTDTGRGPADGSVPTTSPFVEPVQYTEIYDGNGNTTLMPRNSPIQSISSLMIGPLTIQASTSWGQSGYFIASDGKRIVLRGGTARTPGGLLTVGFFNQSLFPRGFRFGTGNPDIDAGLISITYTAGYNGVPADIEMETRKMVAENFRSRGWIGQRSQSMANGAGTIVYRDWAIAPSVRECMERYVRRSLAS